MNIRLRGLSFLTAITLAATLVVLGPGNAGAVKFLSFGTGSPAGTYYFLGAGFAAIVNKHVPGVRVTAESTAEALSGR